MESFALQRQSPSQSLNAPENESLGGKSMAPPPFQLKADSPSSGQPIQRYPIAAKGKTKVESVSGRPNAKSNKGTIQNIIDKLWADGPQNDLENALYKLGSKSKAVDAIVNQNFLSLNGAAICHKEAISNIEDNLVYYANLVLAGTNDSTMDGKMDAYIKQLTCLDGTKQSTCLSYINIIRNAPSNTALGGNAASDIATYMDYLLLELDGSHSNLYIGFARTNSSIGDNFDPHYNVYDTGDPSATPISSGIYNSQVEMNDSWGTGHSSPRRDFDGTDYWNETSSLPDKGYIVYDHKKNDKL